MRKEAHPPTICLALRRRWILVFGLTLAGCGRTDDARSPTTSSTGSTPAPQTPVSGPRWLDAQAIPANAADAYLDPVRLRQLSALPHLSALSAREKAGLLLLLPPMSPSERLILINMYPSLVRLPVQQKQVLLDKLEQIVPVAKPGLAENGVSKN